MSPALLVHMPRDKVRTGSLVSPVHERLENFEIPCGQTLCCLHATHYTALGQWHPGKSGLPLPNCMFLPGPMVPPFPHPYWGQAPGRVVKGLSLRKAFGQINRACSLRLNLWMWNPCWRETWIWASHFMLVFWPWGCSQNSVHGCVLWFSFKKCAPFVWPKCPRGHMGGTHADFVVESNHSKTHTFSLTFSLGRHRAWLPA